ADQPWRLECAGNAQSRSSVRGTGGQDFAVEQDIPSLRCVVARNGVQGRSLAAAIWTNQTMHLASANLEAEVVDCVYAAETERGIVNGENALRRRFLSQHARQ